MSLTLMKNKEWQLLEEEEEEDDDEEDVEDAEEKEGIPQGRVGHSLHLFYELLFLDGNDNELNKNGRTEKGQKYCDDEDDNEEISEKSELNKSNSESDKISELEEKSETNESIPGEERCCIDEFQKVDKNFNSNSVICNKTKECQKIKTEKVRILGKYKLVLFGGGVLKEEFAKNYYEKCLYRRVHLNDNSLENYENAEFCNIEDGLYKTLNDLYICEEKNNDYKKWKKINTYNTPDPRAFHGSCIVNLGLTGVFLVIHGGKFQNEMLADDTLYALNLSDNFVFSKKLEQKKKENSWFEDNFEKKRHRQDYICCEDENSHESLLKQEVTKKDKGASFSLDDNSNCMKMGEVHWNYDFAEKLQENKSLPETGNQNKECSGYSSEQEIKENKININKSFENCTYGKRKYKNFTETSAIFSTSDSVSKGSDKEKNEYSINQQNVLNSCNVSNISDTLNCSYKIEGHDYEKHKDVSNSSINEYLYHSDNSENVSKLSSSSTFSSSTDISNETNISSMSSIFSRTVFPCNRNICDYLSSSDAFDNSGYKKEKTIEDTNNEVEKIKKERIEVIEKKWIQIKVRGKRPSSRYGHTLDFLYPYLVLFGGNEKIGDFESKYVKGDLWVLNLKKCERKKNEEVEEEDFLIWQEVEYRAVSPSGRFFHATCVWYDKIKKKNYLILYGGKMKNKALNANRLFCLQKKGNIWSWSILPIHVEGINEHRAYHSMIHVNNYIFIIGGEEYKYKHVEKLPSALYSLETKKIQYIDNFTAKACFGCFSQNDLIYTWGGFTDIPFRRNFLPNNLGLIYTKSHIFELLTSDNMFEEANEDSEYLIGAETGTEFNIYNIVNDEFTKLTKRQAGLEKNLSLQVKINSNLNNQLKMHTLQNQKLMQMIHLKQRQNAYLMELLKKEGSMELLNHTYPMGQINPLGETYTSNLSNTMERQHNVVKNVIYPMELMVNNTNCATELERMHSTAVKGENEFINMNYLNCLNEINEQGNNLNNNVDYYFMGNEKTLFQTLDNGISINNSNTLGGSCFLEATQICNEMTDKRQLNNKQNNQSVNDLPMGSNHSINVYEGMLVNPTGNFAESAIPFGSNPLSNMDHINSVYDNNNSHSNAGCCMFNNNSNNISSNNISSNNISNNSISNINHDRNSMLQSNNNGIFHNNTCGDNKNINIRNVNFENSATNSSIDLEGSNITHLENAGTNNAVRVVATNEHGHGKSATPRARRKTAERCLQLIENDRLSRLKKEL